MFKGALNLTCFYVFYIIFQQVLVTNAESESKEHVHIKLHMPSVVRKQSHYHHHHQQSKRHYHPQQQYDSYKNYAPAAISSHHLLPAQTLPKQLAFTDDSDGGIEDYTNWYSSSEQEGGDQIIPTHLTQDFVMFPKPTATHETQIITQQFSTGVDNDNVDDNNKSNEIIVTVGKELAHPAFGVGGVGGGGGGGSGDSIIPSNSAAALAAAMRSNKKQQQLLQQILHQQPEIINVASATMPKGNKYRTHQIYVDGSEDTSDDLLTTHGGLEMSSLGGDDDALTVDDIGSQLLYAGGAHTYKFPQFLHPSRLRKRSKYKNPIKSQRLRTTQILTGAYPSLTRLKLRNQNYDKHLHQQQQQQQQQQQLQQQKDFNLPSTSLGQDSYVGTGHALRAASLNLHDHSAAVDLSDESENLSSEETINSKSNAFNYRDLFSTHTTPIAQSLPLKSPFRSSSSLTSATLAPSTYHPSFTSYTSSGGTQTSPYQWLQQQHYGHLPKTSINTIPLSSSATVTSIASHQPSEVSNFSVNSQTTSRHKKSKNRLKNKRNRLVIR
uniref:Uncharacterized protein n=1 Tax=Glossina pallidipes TaxID=7398 RepID=A0A1A9Z0T3_GLOPL